MALGTNLNTDIFFGRASLELMAAVTANSGLEVLGMNILFHNFPFLPIPVIATSYRCGQPEGLTPPQRGAQSTNSLL